MGLSNDSLQLFKSLASTVSPRPQNTGEVLGTWVSLHFPARTSSAMQCERSVYKRRKMGRESPQRVPTIRSPAVLDAINRVVLPTGWLTAAQPFHHYPHVECPDTSHRSVTINRQEGAQLTWRCETDADQARCAQRASDRPEAHCRAAAATRSRRGQRSSPATCCAGA